MRRQTYGQHTGLSRALEMVGERWTLLIIRDLLVGPRRFTELHVGLPRIPTNTLSARLRDLEAEGVVRRSVAPRPATGVVYELTDYGLALEQPLVELARWGSRRLGTPREGEVVTPDSMIMAVRAAFRAQDAGGIRAGFQITRGALVLHARVDGAQVDVGLGDLPDFDPALDALIAVAEELRPLLAGDVDPEQALAEGIAEVSGRPDGLQLFMRLFRLPEAAPLPVQTRTA